MKPGTPLPWKIGRHTSSSVDGPSERNVCSTGGYQDNFSDGQCYSDNEANAAYIVHAANLHNELVEALEALTLDRHTHIASEGGDRCAKCGFDIRNTTVHFASGESGRTDMEKACALVAKARASS